MQPRITRKSANVLEALREYGPTRGFELRKLTGLPAQDLRDAVVPLVNSSLITASGPLNPESIDSAQFAPLSQAFNLGSLIVEE